MSRLDSTTRSLLIQRLLARAAEEGGLTNELADHFAALLEVTRRQVRRLVAEGRREAQGSGLKITEELYDLYFAALGNCNRMHERLVARGGWSYSLRSLQVAVKRDICPADRHDARHGAKARRGFEAYGDWEAKHRNEIWMVDIKELDNIVIPTRGSKPQTVYLIAYLDVKTRAIVGYAIGLTKTAADVVLGLRDAVVVHEARGPFGGVPTKLMLDNALEHLAIEVLRAAEILGIYHQATTPYAPWLRGKLERFFRTLREEFSAEWPFYTHAPFRPDGSHHASLGEPMTLDELYERLVPWIDRYNRARPHRALRGRTPEQAWLDDPTPLQFADAEAVRQMAIPREARKIGKHGIRFSGSSYLAPEITSLGGEKVEIRYSRNALQSIEVFIHDKWLCTAIRSDVLTTTERGNSVRARQASAARAISAHQKRLLSEEVESAARGASALRDLRPDEHKAPGVDATPDRDTRPPSNGDHRGIGAPRKNGARQTSGTSREVLDALRQFGLGRPLNRPLNEPLTKHENTSPPSDALGPPEQPGEVVEEQDGPEEGREQ